LKSRFCIFLLFWSPGVCESPKTLSECSKHLFSVAGGRFNDFSMILDSPQGNPAQIS
jgi:hypothetical protein